MATSSRQTQSPPRLGGELRTTISASIVALFKECYGRGPTRSKTYYDEGEDLVVCILRGGFSRVEQTLLDAGRGGAVIQQRIEFQEVMRERFAAVVEQATGRSVIGFMSGSQQRPDMMCEVFVLAPSDLLGEAEIPASRAVAPIERPMSASPGRRPGEPAARRG